MTNNQRIFTEHYKGGIYSHYSKDAICNEAFPDKIFRLMFLWIGEINTSFDIALSTISDTTNEIYESFIEFNSFSHSVPVADRYADRVILNPENLLGLKINGFKYDSQLRCIQRETAEFEVSDVYSVLAKLKNATKTIGWSYECVGDFSTYSAAKEYMKSLMTRYSLSPSSCTDTIAN